ncbi:MAG: AmmeMemoRadiSam system protein B, partial [Candidatus Caldatribacteriaceae bacterium]
MVVRQPVVAGFFYPSQKKELCGFIETMVTEETKHELQNTAKEIGEATGVVSPHAGYIYSGKLSAFSFYLLSLLSPVETVVLIGPNHRGIGAKVALAEEDAWQTPLGIVSVDKEAVEFLRRRAPLFQVDSLAHRFEHSLEVQLPFLQYFLSYNFQILPLSLIKQDLATAKAIAEALLALRKQRKIFIVASSDFSHYESAKVAMEKDSSLISQILSLDLESFYRKIYDQR